MFWFIHERIFTIISGSMKNLIFNNAKLSLAAHCRLFNLFKGILVFIKERSHSDEDTGKIELEFLIK